MAIHFRRKGVFLMKLEAVEGTAETFGSLSDDFLVYDVSVTPDIQKFLRKPFVPDLGVLPPVWGKRLSSVAARFEFKSHGDRETTPAVTDKPEWDPILEMCGFQPAKTLKSMDTGAAPSGTFKDGETITGGTSSETATLFKKMVTGVDPSIVLFHDASGAFTAGETITGSVSGATLALGNPTNEGDYGNVYFPDSNGGKSATVAVLFPHATGNTMVLLAGCRAELRIVASETGEPLFGEITITGRIASVGEQAFTPAQTFDPKPPLPFMGAGFTARGVGAGSPATWSPIFSQFALDMGSTIAVRDSSNNSEGILSAIISDREPTVEIDPELVEAAVVDFYAAQTANTLFDFSVRAGSGGAGDGRGNHAEIHVSRGAFAEWDLAAERNGIQILNQTIGAYKEGLTGISLNREVAIVTR